MLMIMMMRTMAVWVVMVLVLEMVKPVKSDAWPIEEKKQGGLKILVSCRYTLLADRRLRRRRRPRLPFFFSFRFSLAFPLFGCDVDLSERERESERESARAADNLVITNNSLATGATCSLSKHTPGDDENGCESKMKMKMMMNLSKLGG